MDNDRRAESVQSSSRHPGVVQVHPVVGFDMENHLLPESHPRELEKLSLDLNHAAPVADNQAQRAPAESATTTASTSARPVRTTSRKHWNNRDEDHTCADCGL